MQVVRVDEVPQGRILRQVSFVLDGREAYQEARMIASLARQFDVKAFLSARYGEPDVDYNEAFCWRLKLEQEFFVELKLMHGELILWLDSTHATTDERRLVMSHFLAMLTEESKSPWKRQPLGMERVLPVQLRV